MKLTKAQVKLYMRLAHKMVLNYLRSAKDGEELLGVQIDFQTQEVQLTAKPSRGLFVIGVESVKPMLDAVAVLQNSGMYDPETIV